ncbi:DUF4215 domain-containing protein [Polyangium spumosum]|uniref:DUF4215 domain-containing protein n=1 Tax=Polyangium spumosum TaxID=889282 RepID=A0A6N7PKE5_9BACT|nr:DUF4215 domain-containing protein [Polyangium spumosum]MRG92488.1 DUF4215 domain-containing protein [Polyangium spumosum]
MQSNSRGLAAMMAIVGLTLMAPFAGCSGDDPSKPPGTGGTGGAGGDGGMGGAGGEGEAVCGNARVEGSEACDDGNIVVGDGCENDCSFTCNSASPATGDVKCDDGDPCNGDETCQDDHTCAPGTPAADGKDCGAGKICNAGVCVDDTCGDGFVSGSEECDDGNLESGDGCDSCKWSCVSSDPTRDCSNIDQCVGTTCDDATHTCGKPLSSGEVCAAGAVCVNGACTPTVCGDGVVDPGENCDDGNLANGDGCDADCTLSCEDPATDCPAAPACQVATCNANNVCANAPDAAQNGQMCGAPDLVCQNGACLPPTAVCGNGTVEGGEECDFGAQNGPGTGCETTCQFSCDMDADCVDAETCNGSETCVAVTVGGNAGKACSAGMPQANCSTCAGGVCSGGACKPSSCGDGCVDASAGEECDPPGASCSAACKLPAVCGDGVREGAEQCDDGNTTNLDGCDSACKFEQIQRAQWLKMQYATDAFCMANRLGGAIASVAQSQLQTSLDGGVLDGSINIMFAALGLDDLTGTTDPMIQLGVLRGSPQIPMGATYDGTADLDWWYTIDPNSIDANRNPLDKLTGAINAKVLTAGPGKISISVNFSGVPALLDMTSTRITASVGAVSTPLTSAGGPPGHLASENLDPALQTFASNGQKNDNGAGKLCGNVSAASLAKVAVPDDLVAGGALACNQGYTASNSLLDVIVNGCNVTFFNIAAINASDPDLSDPGAPVAGAGHPYDLQVNAQTKVVSTCRDKNGATVDLQTCLNAAAYSSFYKFATGRVIAK